MRKIERDEINSHLKNISKNGFTLIEEYLSKKEVDKALSISKRYWDKSCKLEKEHAKGAKTVYGLETKEKFFLELVTNKPVKTVLMHFINDPYFRALPKEIPNYHIGYYLARSSNNALLTHLDSYVPFKGDFPIIMQCLFALEKQTLKNGCTYVVPGSHLSGKYPNQKIEYKTAINILSKPGDLVIWDSRIWHGARKNKTKETRWALVATFMRHWIKARLDATRNISKEYYSKLSGEEKALLGFCSIPPHDLRKRITPRMSLEELYSNPDNFYYSLSSKIENNK